MLPISDMLLFVDIIKLSSFSAAAKKHEITAAAVSKRISGLEEDLGIKLINRTTRRLSPTEAGKVMYAQFEKIYNEATDAYNAVLDTSTELRGILKVRAPISFGKIMLADLFNKFAQEHPHIMLHVDLNDERNLINIGDYDVTIYSGLVDDTTIISQPLTRIRLIVVGTPEYFRHHPIPKHPEDLTQHNCLDVSYRPIGRIWTFFKGKQQFFIPIKGNLITNSPEFVREFTLKHSGLMYAPTFFVADEVRAGKLVHVLADYNTVEAPVSFYYNYKKDKQPRKVQEFIEYITKHISRDPVVI